MPTYSYRCPSCGPFDVVCSMTEVEPGRDCPDCAAASPRVFSAPAVCRVAAPLARALDAQERSAHEPRVVTDVPASRRPLPITTDPRHTKLPRP
jgi:putative FmdB family regulatory protein